MKRFGRLVLRQPAGSDLDRHFEIHGDPATNFYDPAGPTPNIATSERALARWIEHWRRHGFGPWAVAAADNPDRLIGFGGISYRTYVSEERLNLGFRFAPEAWGRGLATELGRAGLEHAFEDLGSEAVFALVRPANLPSIRTLERLGMRRDGFLDDVPGQAPSFVYVMTAEDFRAMANKP